MIKFWSYEREFKKFQKSIIKNIEKTIKYGNIFFGNEINSFEKEFIKKYKAKYGVAVGTSLDFWEGKGWITKHHPYGWVQWYCDYYSGKRSADDARQIKRWQQLAGPNGRFRKWLITMIMKKGGKLVYSTCSIDAEENTGLISKIIETHTHLEKLDEVQLIPNDINDGAYAALLG